jgi:hypothetical protein
MSDNSAAIAATDPVRLTDDRAGTIPMAATAVQGGAGSFLHGESLLAPTIDALHKTGGSLWRLTPCQPTATSGPRPAKT